MQDLRDLGVDVGSLLSDRRGLIPRPPQSPQITGELINELGTAFAASSEGASRQASASATTEGAESKGGVCC